MVSFLPSKDSTIAGLKIAFGRPFIASVTCGHICAGSPEVAAATGASTAPLSSARLASLVIAETSSPCAPFSPAITSAGAAVAWVFPAGVGAAVAWVFPAGAGAGVGAVGSLGAA